jgi:hypothetical protein
MKSRYSWNFDVLFSSFSQSITVNTTSYTASELVNQILINSPVLMQLIIQNQEHSLAQQTALAENPTRTSFY